MLIQFYYQSNFWFLLFLPIGVYVSALLLLLKNNIYKRTDAIQFSLAFSEPKVLKQAKHIFIT